MTKYSDPILEPGQALRFDELDQNGEILWLCSAVPNIGYDNRDSNGTQCAWCGGLDSDDDLNDRGICGDCVDGDRERLGLFGPITSLDMHRHGCVANYVFIAVDGWDQYDGMPAGDDDPEAEMVAFRVGRPQVGDACAGCASGYERTVWDGDAWVEPTESDECG